MMVYTHPALGGPVVAVQGTIRGVRVLIVSPHTAWPLGQAEIFLEVYRLAVADATLAEIWSRGGPVASRGRDPAAVGGS